MLVDPDLGTIRVEKIDSVTDIGTVMNLKTAANQIMAGSYSQETKYDPNNGRIVTRDMAQYLVPVNADIPEIEYISRSMCYRDRVIFELILI